MVRTRFGWNESPLLAGLALVLSAFGLSSCALDSPVSAFSVRVPDFSGDRSRDVQPAGSQSLWRLDRGTMALNPPTGMSAPTALGDFSCFGLMVSAPDISVQPPCNSYKKVNPEMPDRPGVLAGLVDINGGEINMKVPSGPNRLVQLFGIQSTKVPACQPVSKIIEESQTTSTGTVAGSGSGTHDMGDPIELARASIDLFTDSTISLKPVFDPAIADSKVIFQCNGESGNSGSFGPRSINSLVLWLNASSSAGAVDGASPSSWSDNSGANHHLLSSGSPMPVFCSSAACGGPVSLPAGKPFMRFDGGSANFNSQSSWMSDPAMDNPGRTVIIVNYVIANANTKTLYAESFMNGMPSVTGCPSGICNNFLNLKYDYPSPQYVGSLISNTGGSFASTPMTGGSGVWHVTSLVRRINNNLHLYVDGLGSAMGGLSVAPSSLTRVVIGADGTTTNALYGGIAEVLVYSSEIGDREREKLECQLRDKYGIVGGSFGSTYGCAY